MAKHVAVVACILMVVTFAAVPVPAAPSSAPSVSYVMRVVEKSDPACRTTRERCPSITLRYPVFTRAPTIVARQTLNRTVSGFMLKDFLGKQLKTIDAVVADFFREAAEERRVNPQIPPWFLERTIAVAYNGAPHREFTTR